MAAFDDIVIGLGLAGAAVAWRLRWAGRRVLVIDRGGPGGASRVAAGLVTPITGLRLVKTPRIEELFPAAVAFYRRVEAETGTSLLTVRSAVRLFANADERAVFERRTAEPAFRSLVREPDPPVNPEWFAAPLDGFEMSHAARLDVGRYLDATRDHFAADGCILTTEVDPGRDVELMPDGVEPPPFGSVFTSPLVGEVGERSEPGGGNSTTYPPPAAFGRDLPHKGGGEELRSPCMALDGVALPRLGVEASRLVFCQGLDGRANPWFPEVRFTPAKGEVLTLRIPGLSEERVIHRGVWLASAGGGLFRAGATYDRDDLTPTPTDRGREEVCSRLREFLLLPFEVVGHAAGVRPVVDGGLPVFGIHPDHPQLAHLNGLGSKGVLLAPTFAARLVYPRHVQS